MPISKGEPVILVKKIETRGGGVFGTYKLDKNAGVVVLVAGFVDSSRPASPASHTAMIREACETWLKNNPA